MKKTLLLISTAAVLSLTGVPYMTPAYALVAKDAAHAPKADKAQTPKTDTVQAMKTDASAGAKEAAEKTDAKGVDPTAPAGTQAADAAAGIGAAADASTGEAPAADAGTAPAGETAAPAEEHAAGAAPAHEEIEIPKQHWQHKGVLGTYDHAALQRGFQVYKEVCAACHPLKYISYRNLEQLGYTPDQIKTLAAEYTVTDGPNDDGEMFERPAKPSDPFHRPFANDKAARAANGGALPPDLSMVVKAREHGEDYIYALLTGFETPPAGFPLNPGMNYNKYFAGHQIAMAQPLSDGQVAYGDGTGNSLSQEAKDVTEFLSWAAEPHMEERKFMGIKVVLFMLVFAGIMLAAKRSIWARAHD